MSNHVSLPFFIYIERGGGIGIWLLFSQGRGIFFFSEQVFMFSGKKDLILCSQSDLGYFH